MNATTDEAQIRDLLSTYEGVLNASDAEGAASLWSRDGVFYPYNLPTAAGAGILDAYVAGFDTRKLSIAFEVHEVVVDRDIAFASTGSRGEVTVFEQGLTAFGENRELFVFVREGQEWKIGRYMFNKAAV